MTTQNNSSYRSHYDWLERHLDDFWIKVFGLSLDETNCAGIISAHGDKGYGYKKRWEDAGIHFFHGMAIYLLTYTPLLGETPKHLSAQWVQDNYSKFRPLLPDI